MVTPGAGAPEGSRTTPDRVARSTWEKAIEAKRQTNKAVVVLAVFTQGRYQRRTMMNGHFCDKNEAVVTRLSTLSG